MYIERSNWGCGKVSHRNREWTSGGRETVAGHSIKAYFFVTGRRDKCLALSSFYDDYCGHKESIDKRDEEDTEIRVTQV